jgi:DNA-binding GntR family transcriptional regulator
MTVPCSSLLPRSSYCHWRIKDAVKVTRFVEDFMGARLPNPEEERALQLPSGVPVTRNIRTAYAGDRPVEVMDTISHGEVVSHRFEIRL